MRLLVQIALGSALIFASVAIQLTFISYAIAFLEAKGAWLIGRPHNLRTAIALGAVSLWLLAGHSLTTWLWAIVFLSLGAFHDLETSLYFSIVVFTTLGFGDIIPPQPWRLLAGMSASNGLLMFGVSTAFLVEALRQIWLAQKGNNRDG